MMASTKEEGKRNESESRVRAEVHSTEEGSHHDLLHTANPFAIQTSRFSDRGTYGTRSVDRGVRKRRLENQVRKLSFDSHEMDVLRTSRDSRVPPTSRLRASGDTDDIQNIEELLPSRLAATLGTRTVALRRGSRTRSRRSVRHRFADDREPGTSDVVALSSMEIEAGDAVDFVSEELRAELPDDWDTRNGLNSIKLHATTMERKRQMRRDLLERLTSKQRPGVGIGNFFARAFKLCVHQRRFVSNASQSIRFWNRSFKEIEGTFGACVVSYFIFVRLLLFVNLFMMLTILATIVLPQILIFSFDFVRENCQNISAVSDTHLRQSCNQSSLYQQQIAVQMNSSNGQKVLDLFLGTGWMENSVMFIGFYSNDFSSLKRFDMALAYLLTTAFYLALIMIFMVVYTGHGLKARMLRFRGEQSLRAFDRVFCGWDYSLSDADSAQEKQKTLRKEFERIYALWLRRQESRNLTFGRRCCLLLRRLFGNFVVFALLVGAGAAIAATIMIVMPTLQSKRYIRERNFLLLVVSFLPSLILTVLNAVLPMIFRNLVLLEKYAEETQMKITLVRTVFLRLASIAVLVTTFIVQFNQCTESPCRMSEDSSDVTYCWETYMGQQLYRLVLLDFIMVLFVIVFYEYPLSVLSKRFPNCCFFGQREFNVPGNVIDITYTQALCWIGAFFSPLIPVITILKLIIFFLIKKHMLMGNYKPKPSWASETTYFFMIILMISFVLCSAAVAYTIGRLPPSRSCGPFRVHSYEKFYMLNALSVAIQLLPLRAQKFLFFLGSWTFYLALVVLFSLLIMWRCLKLDANQELVAFLKERLQYEHSDKEFLLQRVKTMGKSR